MRGRPWDRPRGAVGVLLLLLPVCSGSAWSTTTEQTRADWYPVTMLGVNLSDWKTEVADADGSAFPQRYVAGVCTKVFSAESSSSDRYVKSWCYRGLVHSETYTGAPCTGTPDYTLADQCPKSTSFASGRHTCPLRSGEVFEPSPPLSARNDTALKWVCADSSKPKLPVTLHVYSDDRATELTTHPKDGLTYPFWVGADVCMPYNGTTYLTGYCVGSDVYFAAHTTSDCTDAPAYNFYTSCATWESSQMRRTRDCPLASGEWYQDRYGPLGGSPMRFVCTEPKTPPFARLALSGYACGAHGAYGASNNQAYSLAGYLASGQPYFVGESTPNATLYFDEQCTPSILPRWILQDGRALHRWFHPDGGWWENAFEETPLESGKEAWAMSTTQLKDLDGDAGGCHSDAFFEVPPLKSADVTSLLGPGLSAKTHAVEVVCRAGKRYERTPMSLQWSLPAVTCGSVALSGLACSTTLHGATYLNQAYTYEGTTTDGSGVVRPYYRGAYDRSVPLFYDPNCGGHEPREGAAVPDGAARTPTVPTDPRVHAVHTLKPMHAACARAVCRFPTKPSVGSSAATPPT